MALLLTLLKNEMITFMKVLFANKFFYFKGGSETVFFQERNFLIKRGHEVVDFSMSDERNQPSQYTDFFVPNTN